MAAPVIVQIDPSPVALSVYAAECGVTAETLIAWSQAHEFPAYRLGKVYLVSRLDAYNWWHEKTKGEGRKRKGHTGDAAIGQSQVEETDERPDAFRPSYYGYLCHATKQSLLARRDRFISILENEIEAPRRVVQKLAGHAGSGITDGYSHTQKAQLLKWMTRYWERVTGAESAKEKRA